MFRFIPRIKHVVVRSGAKVQKMHFAPDFLWQIFAFIKIEPTHIIIQVSAGSLPPFTGCPGNVVWCDNIGLVY